MQAENEAAERPLSDWWQVERSESLNGSRVNGCTMYDLVGYRFHFPLRTVFTLPPHCLSCGTADLLHHVRWFEPSLYHQLRCLHIMSRTCNNHHNSRVHLPHFHEHPSNNHCQQRTNRSFTACHCPLFTAAAHFSTPRRPRHRSHSPLPAAVSQPSVARLLPTVLPVLHSHIRACHRPS